jgi:hypothetical protein
MKEKKLKSNFMKKKNWTIIITLGIIILFAITNPSSEEHKEAVKLKVNSFVQNSYKSTDDSENKLESAGYNLGVLLGNSIVDKFIENAISRDSYIVFSITKANWQGKSKAIGYGFLGNVFLSNELDESFGSSFLGSGEVPAEEAPITEDPYLLEEKPVTE